MVDRVSIEGALRFTKLSVLFVCTWPPPRSATKWQMIRADLAWWISFLSVFCLLVPLLCSIYEYRSDSLILTQSAGLSCACAMIVAKTLVLRIHREKCQILTDEMEEFVKTCRDHEKRVLRNYVEACWMFYGSVTAINYLAAISMIVGPFIFPHQQFPTFAVYPFPVDSGLLMYLVFVHQSITGFQCSAAFTVDCQMAILMWYAGARLEILAGEIDRVTDIRQFRSFVRQHQGFLSYANQVAGTMCYVALTTIGICGIASIMFCLQLVGSQPLLVKMQFIPPAVISLVNLMICAWPTENMIRVCDLIGTSIYDSSWFDVSPRLLRDIIMIAQISQHPVRVSVGGFLPALSFRFYAAFLSSVFSYFTTIRLVIMSESD